MFEFKTRYLWLLFAVVFAVTFFTRANIRTVKEFNPATLQSPKQTPVQDRSVIRFKKNGYQYEATPHFDYEINGLIVHALNYWFVIDRGERISPTDVCMIWGDNLKNKVHQSGVRFSQDGRWCYFQNFDPATFRLDQVSNNHLLVQDDKLEARIKKILPGDQVKIKGKLVAVKARLVGKGDLYDSREMTWSGSTKREDTGKGACEVILVEDMQILRHANGLSRLLFQFSLISLILLFLYELFRILRP